MLCLAGAVNRRANIQPKANDNGWVVVPNLWGGIIAPPGFMKSPVIQAATRPLHQIQTEWRHEHEEALEEYDRDKEEYELRRAAWKEPYKANAKKGKTALDRPEDEPEEPTLRRRIVNDATFEAMHQTMSENPAGILVIRDELTGWWSQAAVLVPMADEKLIYDLIRRDGTILLQKLSKAIEASGIAEKVVLQ